MTGTSVGIAIDGKEQTFQQATGKIIVDAYKAIILYISNAGNISSQDIPKGDVTVAVFSERNAYLEEVPLDVTVRVSQAEELKITQMSFSQTEILVTAINTGEVFITINEFSINVQKQGYTPQTVKPNESVTATVTYPWEVGNNYQVKLHSSKGNVFTYIASAPSS